MQKRKKNERKEIESKLKKLSRMEKWFQVDCANNMKEKRKTL